MRISVELLCLLFIYGFASLFNPPQLRQTPSAVAEKAQAKPLIMEKDQGELRIRRSPAAGASIPMSLPTSEFILKVSPQNNGSQHLVLGTEQIRPGGRIRTHKPLEQDEILLIETGTAHVRLGEQEADVHAGGLVFIPANTSIGLQNSGSEAINLVFIFSAPGFEDYMRCTSVPRGSSPTPITLAELKNCAHQGHVEYEDLQGPVQK